MLEGGNPSVPCAAINRRTQAQCWNVAFVQALNFRYSLEISLTLALRHQSWGVPFGELEENIFSIQYKKSDHFGGLVFLVKHSSLGTSDMQGCYSQRKLRI